MDPIATMLVDDHEIVRQGLRRILETDLDIRVVGEAANGLEALERAAVLRPAVVLMDIKMPSMGGLEATRQIRADYPTISVIMMTNYADNALIADAMSAGASRYLVKDASAPLILHTIKAVATGACPADAAQRPANVGISGTDAEPRYLGLVEPLTEGERRVLQCLAEGQTNKEIGNTLGYAEVTVKKRVQAILAKLHASNRTEATTTGLRLGLIEGGAVATEASPADAAQWPASVGICDTEAESRHAGLIGPLTERERTVLQCLAEGQTNKEIGNALGYAEVTVKKYVHTILAKLYATDRTAAATIALRLGLITSDGFRDAGAGFRAGGGRLRGSR